MAPTFTSAVSTLCDPPCSFTLIRIVRSVRHTGSLVVPLVVPLEAPLLVVDAPVVEAPDALAALATGDECDACDDCDAWEDASDSFDVLMDAWMGGD